MTVSLTPLDALPPDKVERLAELIRGSTDSPYSTRPEFNREHIFITYIREVGHSADPQHRASMFFRFAAYNRALRLAQSGKFNLAKFHLEYAQKWSPELSLSLETAMVALTSPVSAYYYYATGTYRKAEESLKRSLRLLRDLENDGLSAARGATIEQALNLFKSAHASGDRSKALYYASCVIGLVTSGACDRRFLPPRKGGGLAATPVEIEQFKHCVNSILRRLLQSNQEDKSVLHTFEVVFSNTRVSKPYPGHEKTYALAQYALNALDAYWCDDELGLLDSLLSYPGHFQELPSVMQDLLRRAVLSVASTHYDANWQHVAASCREKLR